jgi:hypothetical protein
MRAAVIAHSAHEFWSMQDKVIAPLKAGAPARKKKPGTKAGLFVIQTINRISISRPLAS